MNENNAKVRENNSQTASETVTTEKRAYEAPKVVKKQSVSRVTLFSGGGVGAGGLTTSG